MLKRGGTHLKTIPKHQIHIWCACGRVGCIDVADLLAMKKPPVTVADALAIARCSGCGARSIKEFRLSWRGGSEVALRGAEQGKPKLPPI